MIVPESPESVALLNMLLPSRAAFIALCSFGQIFKAQRGLPGGSVVKNLLAYAGDVEDMV